MRASSFSLCFAIVAALGCGGGGRTAPDAGPRPDAQGMDASTTCSGTEDNAAACSDACDNDGDTFVDCEDRGCCSLRTDCPASSYCGGMTDGGPGFDGGTPMMCPGAREPENTLAACSDGCSNDDDGTFDGGAPRIFVDCADYDCCDPAAPARTDCPASTPCGARLMRDGGMPTDGGTAFCTTRGPENTLEACTNGCDDDRNGFFDCGDRGCCLIRTAGGMACGAGTYCATYDPGTVNLCPGDDVTMPPAREATLAACTNDCDDDRNGYEDCDDRGCCLIRTAGGMACGAGTYCADTFVPGMVNLCPGDDVTMPADPEADATACGNSCDDDRDGYEDCEDRDCCAVRSDCPATTYCGRTP